MANSTVVKLLLFLLLALALSGALVRAERPADFPGIDVRSALVR